ncbi:hypothetical protein SADUNF_Sadunf14G0105100 [Salix dunnii]|uniref:CUE domain-containing protein n=1 Tax=Salix dunnii TaxID=1413687 RepID=A0A835MTV5_9ROSI|nr:hypothetical protein SADUNF_Sadunf14G0105100 [Salix dunnii]
MPAGVAKRAAAFLADMPIKCTGSELFLRIICFVWSQIIAVSLYSNIMGFKTVYKCLTDVFPQVDVRILKAVAIEHSKDADVAVEVVLSEIIPSLSRQSAVPSHPSEDTTPSLPSDGENEQEKETGLRRKQVSLVEGVISEPRLVAKEDAKKTELISGVDDGSSTHQGESQDQPIVLPSGANADTNQLQGHIEGEELILLGKPQFQEGILQPGSSQVPILVSNDLQLGVNSDHTQVFDSFNEQTPRVTTTCLGQENGELCGSWTESESHWKAFNGPENGEFDMIIHAKSSQVESCVDDIVSAATYSVAEQTPDSAEDTHHSDFCGDSENMNSKQHGQIELLEENVKAAKDNKKTLFLEMESVMNLMKEAELKEMAAEQAKDEAARGGLDILIKVEELKQMLIRAKEANDMHAGEVYGEKAILATEVRELQARLLSLSDEKDNALAILDEMRQTLKSRLAAAEELMKTAELEKLEKEEAAQNALVEQEIIMGKVVQESKILQKEAEENAKLREFLMDRGCVVDTLQGEISVICQDVRLLKEKFDERVPLSKSVSSSQTSCILASSGSSVKSLASDLAAEIGETSEHPKEPVGPCSADDQSPELHHKSVERASSNKKQLLDDGWDFV